jgi:hypothetical protein
MPAQNLHKVKDIKWLVIIESYLLFLTQKNNQHFEEWLSLYVRLSQKRMPSGLL